MSAHSIPAHLKADIWNIPDPGHAGTIDLSLYGDGVCHLVSTAAQTRILPAPSVANQKATLVLETDGGDITVTVKDADGSTTFTHVFADAGAVVSYIGVRVGGTLRWAVTHYGLGAAMTAANASTVDGTYGAEESAVIANLRTRLGEVEAFMEASGIAKAN